MSNLVYSTAELEKYFSKNRIRWDQFYKSERVVIEKTGLGPDSEILDIGCGCAGLGMALRERFGATRYTGIEINADAAQTAKGLYPEARILSGDFLTMGPETVAPASYDVVFSLSCIDWNLTFKEMLDRAWSMVKPGGVFIASFRLTTGPGINDMARSYQYISYDGEMNGELAPYVVVNAAELLGMLVGLGAGKVYGYGYDGAPSKTAVTPYKELCFAVLAVQKAVSNDPVEVNLDLPPAVLASLAGVIAPQ
jgi:SAM-dependent methyltransferase